MGKLWIVGIGPGEKEQMTQKALAAMEAADILCGYTLYIDLVRELFPEKETYTSSMMQEMQRCSWAIEQAEKGKNIAMLCSGDAGLYGMAGLLLQLAEGKQIEIEIVAGITAALSGAAVLGAPLTHDFCVISLSDLLTPWETIERRLEAAGYGDFSVCIYNSMSKKRQDHLKRACEILLRHKKADTVCGWVKNIGREGQESALLTLAELKEAKIDMLTTVFVGNSSTKILDGRMVTPRGYESKYERSGEKRE